MKKAMFLIAVLVVLPFAVFASGSTEQQASGPATLTLWYPAGEITVTSLPFRDGSKPWADFEAANNVKIDMVAVDYDTMQQKVFTALAGGKAPDIAFIDGSWMGGYRKDGSLVQVPAADAKSWLGAVSPEIVALSDQGNGQMYGYPSWGIDAYAITWNKDIFREVGLNPDQAPKYLADFVADSKKTSILNADGTFKRVGYAIRHLGQPHGIVDKWEWLIHDGDGQLNTDMTALTGGKTILDTPNMVKVFQGAHDMVWGPNKSTSLNFPDPRDAFLKGIAAFQISEVISIQVRQPKEAPNLKWGFAPPPAREAGSTPSAHTAAWFLSVFSQSAHKDLAMKAITWFDNVDNDYKFSKMYNSTPRYNANWNKEPFASDPYDVQFKTLLPYGRPYPLSLAFNGIPDATGAAIQKILHNEMAVQPALQEAQTKANQAIADLK
jgi:multiple sugar transport system substrate-binding protein